MRFSNRLDKVKVASPCPADWDGMVGNDCVRFCSQCQLNVYNLSGMTRHEAESLIAKAEGRLCVRYYRRRDGSIITSDCPVGLAAIKRRLSKIKTAAASAVIGFLAALGFDFAVKTFMTPIYPVERTMGTIAFQGDMIEDRREQIIRADEMTMGRIAVRPVLTPRPTRKPRR